MRIISFLARYKNYTYLSSLQDKKYDKKIVKRFKRIQSYQYNVYKYNSNIFKITEFNEYFTFNRNLAALFKLATDGNNWINNAIHNLQAFRRFLFIQKGTPIAPSHYKIKQPCIKYSGIHNETKVIANLLCLHFLWPIFMPKLKEFWISERIFGNKRFYCQYRSGSFLPITLGDIDFPFSLKLNGI